MQAKAMYKDGQASPLPYINEAKISRIQTDLG